MLHTMRVAMQVALRRPDLTCTMLWFDIFQQQSCETLPCPVGCRTHSCWVANAPWRRTTSIPKASPPWAC